MNIPFFGRFGTKFGTASNTNPGVTDPGAGGDFVEVAMADETAGSTTTKTVNSYGNGTSAFEDSCGLIFQKEAAACVGQSAHKFRQHLETSQWYTKETLS